MMAVLIYAVTKDFPAEEKFGLTSQIRRAAIAVPSNVAEGSGRKTAKDQAHFYHIAYSSALELLNQLIISNDLDFITADQLMKCRILIEQVSNKLNSLRKSLVS